MLSTGHQHDTDRAFQGINTENVTCTVAVLDPIVNVTCPVYAFLFPCVRPALETVMETSSEVPPPNESLDGLTVSQFAPSSVLTDAVHFPAVLPQLLIVTIFVSGGMFVKSSFVGIAWIHGGCFTIKVTFTVTELEPIENVMCPVYVPAANFALKFEAVITA